MRHSHRFVETYEGPVAFGLDRETDEASLMVFLQKFSDDDLLVVLTQRLSLEEIHRLVNFLTELMKRHLSEEEYHRLFLKEAPSSPSSDSKDLYPGKSPIRSP